MLQGDSITLSSRTHTSPHSAHRLSLSLIPKDRLQQPTRDSSTYTLKKRPWMRYITPFPAIFACLYPGSGTEGDPYLIDWLPKGEVQDKENPLSWPQMYQWSIMVLVAVASLCVALASSAMSAADYSVMQSFPGYMPEVYTLVLAMFVLGFALGPLLWAPAGEVSGRRNLYVFTSLLFRIFNGALCGSQSVEALIVLRFSAGVAGASPLTNTGGTVADLFTAEERGLGMVIFSTAPFLGPALGPICGGFLGETAEWRWVGALLAIFSGVLTVIGYLFLPETYPVVLLRRRAKLLEKATGKMYIYKGDKGQDLRIKVLYKRALSRPWLLLFKEPIVFLLAIYMTVIIGTLYLLFGAFPIVFQEERGWSPGIGGLSFIGVLVGCIIALLYSVFYENPRYARKLKAAGGWLRPEERLPSAILGGIMLPIVRRRAAFVRISLLICGMGIKGMFSFAWTAAPASIPWIAPIICSVPFGTGMVLLFLSVFNYLVDAYLIYSASVLAGNVVLRCLSGMAFPLFTRQMYNSLGINWASTSVAFLSLARAPLPMYVVCALISDIEPGYSSTATEHPTGSLFYIYGERIRVKTKFGREANEIGQAMRRRLSGVEKSRDYQDTTAGANPSGPSGI